MDLISKEEEDWRPSMSLSQLIQQIPGFVADMIRKKGKPEFEQDETSKEGARKVPKMYGKFHLGMQYDLNIWLSNSTCGVFQCQEEKLLDQN
jgi:hypothetical protein